MHDSVNVTLDPEYREKILDQSLFLYHCPHCGNQVHVEYGVLYHDMEQKIMIQVCSDAGSALDMPPLNESLKGTKQETFAENYRLRCVAGILRLIEKIRIFEAGLDDYAVEILKAWLWNGIEGDGEKELFFDSLKEGKLEFAVCYENGECCGFTVPYEDYGECVGISDSLSGKDLLQYVDCSMFLPMFEEESRSEHTGSGDIPENKK